MGRMAEYAQAFDDSGGDDAAAWHEHETEGRRLFDEAVSNTAHRYYQREREMKTSAMIQSKYLKKEDFDTPRVMTIKDCQLEEVGNNGDTRWCLYFKEDVKGLVLNVTKIRQLEAAFGDDTDHWNGQRVKLTHDPNVAYAGKIVGGIALQTPPKQGVKAPTPPPPPADDFSDDVPF